jgi:hypothetical protein
MTKITTTLAAGLLLGGLGIGLSPASAAPAVPAASALVDGLATTEVGYRRGYRHRHGMRSRMMRRGRAMRSDPNSRNPSQPGYQQRKGQTTGGPRF